MNMEIIEIPNTRIHEIEPLWNELNLHHLKHSENFKEHFSEFTFAERSRKLLSMENLAIFGATADSALIAYCIASRSGDDGEIDSIYVRPAFQKSSIGQQLTERAISWLSSLGCRQISVCVAEGNEAAIPFYERLGFRHRFHVLQIRNP
jgi:ribosomal protein S18 acetylase RimI-like enzyme